MNIVIGIGGILLILAIAWVFSASLRRSKALMC